MTQIRPKLSERYLHEKIYSEIEYNIFFQLDHEIVGIVAPIICDSEIQLPQWIRILFKLIFSTMAVKKEKTSPYLNVIHIHNDMDGGMLYHEKHFA